MLFKSNHYLLGSIYFLVLMLIALIVRDIPGQQNSFNTVQQLIAESKMGDPVSFATAAIDVAKLGWTSAANDWIFNLWPPGFILLEALILKTFGLNAHIILILQAFASLLFSVVLVLTSKVLQKNTGTYLAMSLPLLIFAFPISRVFLLEPTAVTLGESFAIGFFLLAILLAFRAVESNSISNAIYAGLFLALSAYFRSQFEIILLSLTLFGLLFIFFLSILFLKKINSLIAKSILKTIVIMLLVAHTVTIPWRLYHWINQGKPVWVYTGDVIFKNSVMTSDNLKKNMGGFVVDGAGNLTCRIEPTACGNLDNAKELFFNTFISNPIKWYSFKYEIIGKYWFSSIKNWTILKFDAELIDYLLNGLILAGLIILMILMLSKKVISSNLWIILLWFNLSLLTAYVLIFTLAHFEVRYFYFPKIVTIFMFLIVGSIYFRPISKSNLNKG